MDNIKNECRFCKYYYVRNYTPDGFDKCRARDIVKPLFFSKLPITAQNRGLWVAQISGIGLCYLDCNDCPLTSDYCENQTDDDHCKYWKIFNNKKEKL